MYINTAIKNKSRADDIFTLKKIRIINNRYLSNKGFSKK